MRVDSTCSENQQWQLHEVINYLSQMIKLWHKIRDKHVFYTMLLAFTQQVNIIFEKHFGGKEL